MTLSWMFGPNKIYGIEASLFRSDDIDFEQGSWELFSVKLQFKLLGLRVNVVSLDVASSRASFGFLNCWLTGFWGY